MRQIDAASMRGASFPRLDGSVLAFSVIDDEPAHGEIARRSLSEAFPGAKVRLFQTLGAFAASLSDSLPSLVLCDLCLPDGRAPDLLSEGYRVGEYPVVVMTAFGDEETAVGLIKSGASDYITKSGERFRELPRIVEKALIEYGAARERAQSEARIRGLLEEKELLLREIHHRIKNNMSSVASLLSLQADACADSIASAALEEAAGRVRSMRIIYERLFKSADYRMVPASEYFEDLVSGLAGSMTSSERIAMHLDCEDVSLDSDTLWHVGIMLNELVTNALKYAFPDKARGRVTIGFRSDRDGSYRLTVADDGRGLSADAREGFGLMLVRAVCDQLGADLVIDVDRGTRYSITFKHKKP